MGGHPISSFLLLVGIYRCHRYIASPYSEWSRHFTTVSEWRFRNSHAVSCSAFLTAYVTFDPPSKVTYVGGSKVTYAVKKAELEPAWERAGHD